MASEIRATAPEELRFLVDHGKPRIDARAILFDSWSVDLGGFCERMMPGSVDLDADLVALFDHDTSMVLGRTSAGTMEVRADERGIAFTAFPPDTTWARDLRVSMDRGDIRGCSYRMVVDEDRWYVEDGQVKRDILKALISELTITSMPAYPETTAEARSHAAALAAGEDRALTVADEINLVAAAEILDAASELIEKAGETIKDAVTRVDLEVDKEAPAAPTDPAVVEVDYPDSEVIVDGASIGARSAAGAAETSRQTPVFVPGFGFISNRKET